jgi:hypothetical protein
MKSSALDKLRTYHRMAQWVPSGMPGRLTRSSRRHSPRVSEHFNAIAWEVMIEFDIPIDAYFLNPRPDHRETDAKNAISQKICGGHEVYSVFTEMAMLALETICI